LPEAAAQASETYRLREPANGLNAPTIGTLSWLPTMRRENDGNRTAAMKILMIIWSSSFAASLLTVRSGVRERI